MKLTNQTISRIYEEASSQYSNRSIDDFNTFLLSRVIEQLFNETEYSVEAITKKVIDYAESREKMPVSASETPSETAKYITEEPLESETMDNNTEETVSEDDFLFESTLTPDAEALRNALLVLSAVAVGGVAVAVMLRLLGR